ncbi:hypothetical protein CVT24_008276 [Panaeolus cyanescens]|uniref:Uncharacterized protein n=1 Tax=Panaeolus cyanescens TaxID=181874 RepID=A0A409WTM5_9AGAR|nr:hypothetical protein CVT24_008276 [Panaeolus cyanescens]
MSNINADLTYILRFVGPTDVENPEGVFATLSGYGEPIRGEPKNVTSPESQSWKLFPIEGKEDVYKIYSTRWPILPFAIQDPPPIFPSWGLSGEVPTGNHDLVLLKVCETKWRIKQADGGQGHTISPVKTDGRVGVDYYVDFDERTRMLYIKTIPVILDPPPAPKWELIC